jgi:uncharacterized membrane protein
MLELFLVLYVLPMLIVVSIELYDIRQSWKIHQFTYFSEISRVLLGFVPLIAIFYLVAAIQLKYNRVWQHVVLFDKR